MSKTSWTSFRLLCCVQKMVESEFLLPVKEFTLLHFSGTLDDKIHATLKFEW